VPEAYEKKLTELGRPIPQPVTGHFLVDTGATTTTIADHVVWELRLIKTGEIEHHGVHGKQTSDLYFARFEIDVPKKANNKLSIFKEMQVAAAIDLAKGFPKGVMINDNPLNPIGLIGRDFLYLCRMTYDGGTGRVIIEVDESKVNPPG
jgi:hypothetical protein